MSSPTNEILRCILLEKFRFGQVEITVRDALDANRQPLPEDIATLYAVSGRMEGLIHALTIVAPDRWKALGEVVGITEEDFEQSLQRIRPDFDLPGDFAVQLAEAMIKITQQDEAKKSDSRG
jgi:hypothetical protein